MQTGGRLKLILCFLPGLPLYFSHLRSRFITKAEHCWRPTAGCIKVALNICVFPVTPLLNSILSRLYNLISCIHCFTNPCPMAVPDHTRRFAHTETSKNVNAQWPSLKEYTRAHSASSNDCAWLHEVVSSGAISEGKISSKYMVRVYYKETRAASITTTEMFGTGSTAVQDLKHCFASNYVQAVILCHRDSSRVDPEVLDLLWTKFKLEVSFMRHHFDYKEFGLEQGCPGVIRKCLEKEVKLSEDSWTLTGRWNPVRLPSETRASILRLSIDSECLSVCCRGGVGESSLY